MTLVAVTKSKLDSLAEKIGIKSERRLPLTIDEMGEAVDGIELPNLQAKSVKPSTSSKTVVPDSPHNGLSSVTVEGIKPVRTSSDMTVNAGTVTAPAGWYATDSSKGVASMTLPTSASSTASGTNKATIAASISTRYINIPTGYNTSKAYYTISAVQSGTAGTPTASKGTVSNHQVSVTPSVTNTTGYITGSTKTGTAVTVSASELVSGTKEITANGTGIDVTDYAAVDVSVSSSPNLQAKTGIDPTTSSQTITADNGYDGLSSVQVNAMPSGAVSASAAKGSVSNHAISVTPTATVGTAGYLAAGSTNGTAVSVSASELVSGTYTVDSSGTKDVTNYASASVAAGSVSASATKGSVSNHSVTVTPSVTRTAGWVTAGSANGTAVSVSASELVSGNKEITDNGTGIDVANYSTVSVNVSGGGSSSVSVGTKTATLSSAASSISFTGLSGNPTSFVVTSSADVSTGDTTAVAVAYDGTSLHGMDVTTQAEADTGFSKSYSSGTLTITATTASFQASEYKLVYTYGGSSTDIHTADVQVGSGATSITFSSLSGRPLYFSCVFKSTFSTSSGYQRVIDVVSDGTSTYGHSFDSSAHAATSWSHTYSGGSLTISSTGTNNGGYFHQPGYYQLTYAVDDSAPQYQAKTGIGASTSSQTIYPDTGYDALESVQINAVSQTNLAAANIKSGTTISISNGSTNLWSVTGTYSGGGGGSASIDTKTVTASNRPSSLSFTSMKGEPIAFFLKATFTMTSSSSTYYYVDSMRGYDSSGSYAVQGRLFQMGSTRQTMNVTSGYSASYSGTTLTLTSTGNRTTSPGCFYNGSYELVYVY